MQRHEFVALNFCRTKRSHFNPIIIIVTCSPASVMHFLFRGYQHFSSLLYGFLACVSNFTIHRKHGRLARRIKWRACDVREAKEGLENELWRRWSNGGVGKWATTYVKRRKGWRMCCDVSEVTERLENVIANSPTPPLLHLRHSSFSPFFRFSYVTSSSLNSPGEPPIIWSTIYIYANLQISSVLQTNYWRNITFFYYFLSPM